VTHNEDIETARASHWSFGGASKSFDEMTEEEQGFALELVAAVRKKLESDNAS
jgi:hypothetical protein